LILLDTSVLSRAFRRRRAHPDDDWIRAAILDIRPRALAIPGIVVQEFLSGVKSPETFERLRRGVLSFSIEVATVADHVRAAEINNACRAAAVATSAADCLVAATAVNRDVDLFTTDADFARMAPLCGLRLHKPARRA
jgi:hypothetical protein